MEGRAVAVIGAGLMGRGISSCLVAGGPHEVRLCGRTSASLDAAAKQVDQFVSMLAENGLVTTRGRLVTTTSLAEAVRDAEFVFESITEDLEAKQALFRELEALTGPNVVLCTNTSSLSVTAIAQGCRASGGTRTMAAHFIGPAYLVPLVELCPAAQTAGTDSADGPVARVRRFLTSVGKCPIVLKREIDGFIAARLQAALYRECLHLHQRGVADCDAIDSAVVNGFGRRLNQIGPFQQADFAGVDLVQRTHANFFPQLGKYERDVRADQLVEQGRFGAKNLKGHYDWTPETVMEVAGRRDAELMRRLKADLAARSRL
eukprot:CAMPEP_0179026464 /NCGR_PEP_ID=MMETSP0796-20121207/8526_1 /TAXON_ID=73915 /ORGANISM="Pyrodinium bahamense, Strain pbaha01" /LENGTH=317 /DNA_ID=CAMNT_0020722541 /DNA_START=57 /DNA_END=1010 /DNA_ORIENTATION=+